MTDFKQVLRQNDLEGFGPDMEGTLEVFSPVDGRKIARVPEHKLSDVASVAENAQKAFHSWRSVPGPLRGEFVRLLGLELRKNKEALGRLVTLECGKILAEGLGEVQEMVDVCDYAVGLSRQLYGLTISSERAGHHMREMWHPLGPVAVISAFNFPVAVWSWNAAISLVCGNSIVWKPSEKTPLTALACEQLFFKAAEKFREQGHNLPENLLQVVIGRRDVGQALAENEAFPLVSATGSTAMGRKVNETVARRLGRSLLELGGNNAMIVTPSADLDMAVRAILFGAVGTCGQRCTSLRRVIVHEAIASSLVEALANAYKQIRIGDPFEDETLVGPLIDGDAYEAMQDALKHALQQGGEVLAGGERYTSAELSADGYYVRPALVSMPAQSEIVKHETFAPILYVMRYSDFDQALAIQNDVPQGLSSCIFSTNLRETELFLSATGSDCGLANVNIGTSGAEIGGAFGGEKETGGGRESGSDSWKAYMRRQTQTVNYSDSMPLAQGVVFDL